MKYDLNPNEFIEICLKGTTHEKHLIEDAIKLNVEYELIDLLEKLTSENNKYDIFIENLNSDINGGALTIFESEYIEDFEHELIFKLKKGVYLSIK